MSLKLKNLIENNFPSVRELKVKEFNLHTSEFSKSIQLLHQKLYIFNAKCYCSLLRSILIEKKNSKNSKRLIKCYFFVNSGFLCWKFKTPIHIALNTTPPSFLNMGSHYQLIQSWILRQNLFPDI